LFGAFFIGEKMEHLNDQVFIDGKKRWFVTRLIAAAKHLEVQEMPLSGLNTFSLCPCPTTMADFVDDVKKVIDADFSYPIILDDEGYVMDGRHRIAKALLDDEKTIKFVRFEVTPSPDYYADDD
jgi:hypothetical protein